MAGRSIAGTGDNPFNRRQIVVGYAFPGSFPLVDPCAAAGTIERSAVVSPNSDRSIRDSLGAEKYTFWGAMGVEPAFTQILPAPRRVKLTGNFSKMLSLLSRIYSNRKSSRFDDSLLVWRQDRGVRLLLKIYLRMISTEAFHG